MKFKVILGIAAIVVVSGAAMAQTPCPPGANEFATIGGMNNEKLRVDTTGWDNNNNEIGRFWSALNPADNNNFAGTCPSNVVTAFGEWWDDETGNTNCNAGAPCYGIRGAINGVGCGVSTCFQVPLIILVEDYGTGGPPGVGGTAYFYASRIDFLAAGGTRPYDFAIADNSVNGTTPQTLVTGFEYPQAFVTSSSRVGADVQTTQAYVDAGRSVWAAVDANTPLPDSSVIASYDICTHTGGGDPGRDRSLWTCSDSIPYADDGAEASVLVDCPNTVDDTYVAVGLTFTGGVQSALVGSATQVECNPNVADPEPSRPTIRRKADSPRRPARSR